MRRQGSTSEPKSMKLGTAKSWCVDHGAGSTFVWMYIAADGEPGAGKNKYIGFCEFDGGGNVRTEQKALIGGKQRWSMTKHVNSDDNNSDTKRSKRIYEFDPRTCKLTQKSVKRSDGSTVTDKENVDPPSEDGRRIGLPLPGPDPPAPPEDSYSELPPGVDPDQEDPPVCDINRDGVITLTDILMVLNSRGAPVAAGDPRDADVDGFVTANDARICTQMCTRPLCAR